MQMSKTKVFAGIMFATAAVCGVVAMYFLGKLEPDRLDVTDELDDFLDADIWNEKF